MARMKFLKDQSIFGHAIFIVVSIALVCSTLFMLFSQLLFGLIHLGLTFLLLTGLYYVLQQEQQHAIDERQTILQHCTENARLLEVLQTGLIILDEQTHQILSVNAAAAAMADTVAQEMIGADCATYILPLQAGDHPRNDSIEIGISSEQHLYRPHQAPLEILISFQPVQYEGQPCLLGSFADISAIKYAQAQAKSYTRELQRSRNTLISMMEDADASRKAIAETNEKLALIKQAVGSAQEAIAITAPSGECIYCNTSYENLFGTETIQEGLLNPTTLFADAQAAKKHLELSESERGWSSEALMLRADGTSFPAVIRSNSIRNAYKTIIGRIHVCHDITERKQAEQTQAAHIEELRNAKNISLSMMEDAELARRETERMSQHLATSERRYRAVVEDQQEFICRCGSNFQLTFTNAAFKTLLPNTSPNELTLWDLWPEEVKKAHQTELNELKYKGGTLNVEFILTSTDGTERWTIWTLTALKGQHTYELEYQVVGRDETRRHLAEKELNRHREHLKELVEEKTIELAQTNRKLEANLTLQRNIAAQNMLLAKVIEQSDEMILATDPRGNMIFSNQAYKENSPALNNETAGQEFHEKVLRKIKAQQPWSGIIPCLQPDQTETVFDCRVYPIFEENGHILSVACSQRDITSKARLESQLRQAQKMQAVGTLVGGIAHDFNNLLMSISGFAKLARKRMDDDPKSAKYVDNILIAGKRGSSLVSQLMKFGRPDEVISSPKDDEVNLAQLINEVSTLLSATLPSTITIHKRFYSEGTLFINSGQIHQVLINLCTNASHAMEGEGDLYLTSEDAELDRTASSEMGLPSPGLYACIRVRDTGCGIEPEHLLRIFDPFFTTKEVGKGSGMGLAVAHGIIKEHRGVMRVESTIDVGTEFFIYLPKKRPSEQHSEINEPSTPLV